MRLDTYARYCGPAVVASALGVSRRRAASMLRKAGQAPTRGLTNIDTIGRVLRRPVLYTPPHDQLTLTQWLRENPDTEAVLRASHHFVHVRRGWLTETNGLRQARARVTHVIPLRVGGA